MGLQFGIFTKRKQGLLILLGWNGPIPPRSSLLINEHSGHNATNEHRKPLKGRKTKTGCLGSLQPEEGKGSKLSGFPYCLPYILGKSIYVCSESLIGIDKPRKTLFSLPKGQGRWWPDD